MFHIEHKHEISPQHRQSCLGSPVPRVIQLQIPLSALWLKDVCSRISLESWWRMWLLGSLGDSRVPSNEAAAAFHTHRDTRKTPNEPCFHLKTGKQMTDTNWWLLLHRYFILPCTVQALVGKYLSRQQDYKDGKIYSSPIPREERTLSHMKVTQYNFLR